jgi:hypothetical protein
MVEKPRQSRVSSHPWLLRFSKIEAVAVVSAKSRLSNGFNAAQPEQEGDLAFGRHFCGSSREARS